jgi:peroxiredoxin
MPHPILSLRPWLVAGGLALLGCCLIGAQAWASYEQPALSHTLAVEDPPRPAPDFALPDMDGEVHRLADYRGKVLLINFWATWCPPCRREMPSMQRLYRLLGEEGFAVLAIDEFESEDEVFGFVGQLEVEPEFPILLDATSETAQAYGVRGLPSSFVLDREGRIVYRVIGGREFDHPRIVEAIRALMH